MLPVFTTMKIGFREAAACFRASVIEDFQGTVAQG
jgi:hypothetical protein